MSDTAITIAAAASLLWLAAIPLFPHAKVRPVLVWSTGMLLTWVLLISLYKPWAEENWGYRPLIEDLARELPAGACLRAETDRDMRVMLRYHLSERFRAEGACRYRLVQIGLDQPVTPQAQDQPATPQAGEAVWSGYRPRHKNEVYQLYDHGG